MIINLLLLHGVIIGKDVICIVSSRHGKVKGKAVDCQARQVITLNLAITLRVTLAGIFKIPFHPPYTYCLWKLILYKTGYRVPFKHGYFHIKKFETLYLLFWLVVVIDLERLWKAYRHSVLIVTLRVYMNRRRWWGVEILES